MSSFAPGVLERQRITPTLARTLRELGEFKGRQALHRRQSPQVLRRLLDDAVIRSTEASNRIEGVVAPLDRIRDLAAGRTQPQNRSEQEIAGYRAVLDTIHTNWEHMPLSSNLVLQLHRDLYQYVPGVGGRWKAGNNAITERRADGSETVRFETVAAHRTPQAMDLLHERLAARQDDGTWDPLFLAAAYVLDFLCIHPFTDGNGRLARLLTLLLLYQAGYEAGRYISLEALVEETKDGYYDALYRSSQGWHESEQTVVPWWEYLLGVVLLPASAEFERRVGVLTDQRGAKRQMVIDAVERLPRQFQFRDLERLLPSTSRPTINRVLADLRRQGRIACIRPGRLALWEKT